MTSVVEHAFSAWYIVVMPKRLVAARSPIMGCIHFCIWGVFSWTKAVWLLHWFSLDDLLQNGTFKFEFGTRSSYFGRSIWICCLQIDIYIYNYIYIYVFVEMALSWCSTLPSSRIYLPIFRGFLSWKVLFIRYCMVFCISVDIQHLEMLIVVVHTIFKSFLSWMNLFETVLRTFEIVSKAFELWILHVTVWSLCICSSVGR